MWIYQVALTENGISTKFENSVFLYVFHSFSVPDQEKMCYERIFTLNRFDVSFT